MNKASDKIAVPDMATGAGATRNDPSLPSETDDSLDNFVEEEDQRQHGFRIRRFPRRWKWEFLALACLGLLAGVLTAVLQIPKYQARTGIEIGSVNRDVPTSGPASGGRRSESIDTLLDIQTKVKALQSEELVRRALQRTRAQSADIDAWQPVANGWRRLARIARGALHWARWLPAVPTPSVRVRAIPMTRDIEIVAEASNARLAAALANSICDEFVEESLQARWNVTSQARETLDGMLNKARERVEGSETALHEYAKRAGLSMSGLSGNAHAQALRQTEQQLSSARAEREAKYALVEMAKRTDQAELSEFLDDPVLKNYSARLAELKRQVAQLSTAGTANTLKHLNAEISSLQNAMHLEAAAMIERLQTQYWAAARRESLLRADYENLSRTKFGETGRDLQVDALQHELEAARRDYEALLEQTGEVTKQAGLGAGNMRLLDPATTPTQPYKPSLSSNAAVGLLCGILAGAIWILLRERTDATIRYPHDCSELLGVPELGVIPSGSVKDSAGQSEVAESFRSLLASLLFVSGEQKEPRIFAITSAGEREGRTTVTANLGLALAEIRLRVLVIDTHARNGRLSKLLGFAGKPGLTELFEGDSSVEAAKFAHPTSVAGLFILPCGAPMPSLSRFLYTDRFSRVLEELKSQFDVILFDTPPAIAAPDARLLGRASDGVILVVRAGQTSRQAAIIASRQLRGDGSILLGTVLNDCHKHQNSEASRQTPGFPEYRGTLTR